MLKIVAKKTIDVFKAIALLQLKVMEKRPDIVWYLLNIHRNDCGLTKGEIDNIKYYLEYLGLMNDRGITQEGKKAIETSFVMVPEAGVYRIWYTKNLVFGNRVIHVERIRPVDIIGESTEEFLDYKLYEQRIHRDMTNGPNSIGEFWLKFECRSGDTPKIVPEGSVQASLKLSCDEDKTTLEFTLEKERIQIKETEKLENFDPETNMRLWTDAWDRNVHALEMAYESAEKDQNALKSFQTRIFLEKKSIFLYGAEMDSGWDIEIATTVVPKTVNDARKWLNHIIIEHLKNNPLYITKKRLQMMQKDIIEKSPIHLKFPYYRVEIEDCVDEIKKKSNEIYSMILAADDLTPFGGDKVGKD